MAEHHPGVLQAAFKRIDCCQARLPDPIHLLLHGLQLLLFCSTPPRNLEGSGAVRLAMREVSALCDLA